MKLTSIAIGLVVVAAARAAPQESKPSPDVELETITTERRKVWEELLAAFPDPSSSGMHVPREESLALSRRFLPRFRSLADRSKGTSSGVAALAYAMMDAVRLEEDATTSAVLDDLLASFSTTEYFEQTVALFGGLGSYAIPEFTKKWLERVDDASSSEVVRDAARKLLRETDWAKRESEAKKTRDAHERAASRPKPFAIGTTAPDI
ncbi:MAG TPA: hypothetical protein VKE69_14690, partial [Planctomycetota bacterium]|nr:hypothetical protein [Planctomycetota bacterium]